MIELSKNKSFKTHQLLLSTEIFSKRRKICPRFEEKSEYDKVDAKNDFSGNSTGTSIAKH